MARWLPEEDTVSKLKKVGGGGWGLVERLEQVLYRHEDKIM